MATAIGLKPSHHQQTSLSLKPSTEEDEKLSLFNATAAIYCLASTSTKTDGDSLVEQTKATLSACSEYNLPILYKIQRRCDYLENTFLDLGTKSNSTKVVGKLPVNCVPKNWSEIMAFIKILFTEYYIYCCHNPSNIAQKTSWKEFTLGIAAQIHQKTHK